jgi:5-methylcytosine-specific restriction protein A
MPYAAPHVCARCGGVHARGVSCRPAFEGAGRRRKGQGDTWRRRRDYYLRAHPICSVDGCRLLSAVVDHIVPIAEGGAELDESNWQAMCRRCHQEKSTRDAIRGKTRPR